LAFIAPAAIGFIVFYVWPAIRGFYFSLSDYSLLGAPQYVGIDNYQQMVSDRLFWNALFVTTQYVLINIATQTILALLIAVLMHRLTRSITVRAIIMLPFFVSNVVVAIVWYWMLDPQIGIINELLHAIGLDRVSFFGNPALAMPTSAMAHIQNTAPGPPRVIATATPAMLPPPTRPPTLTSSASRDETWPSVRSLLG
jgi:multiple sugar transport system permease protein